MTSRRSRRKKPKKTAFVPRVVLVGTLVSVVPILGGCSGGGTAGDAISLDIGTYDVTAEDHAFVTLDATTFDTGAPDHGFVDATPDGAPDGGTPDVFISLDVGTFDTGAPDHGFETGPETGAG